MSLLETQEDYVALFLRLIAGSIIFPYGMQKLFGWFPPLGGGVGLKDSLSQLKEKNVPAFLGWLVIIGQSLGSVALIIGFLTRAAALGNFIIFMGALFVHASAGWSMNWNGKKQGEGVEYFVLLLSILLVLIIQGGGAWSVDYWLSP